MANDSTQSYKIMKFTQESLLALFSSIKSSLDVEYGPLMASERHYLFMTFATRTITCD